MVLQTPGGYIETAERIANTLRKHYSWIAFLVPDMAMSAGTVLVMSGDEIWMNYYSRLGPIDPQVERQDGRKGLIPALGYLEKYKEFVDKSLRNELTPVEGAFFVQNFDAAELFMYEQARSLSIELLKKWLAKYKFKNWKRTKTRHIAVTSKMRRDRAAEIGDKLSETKRWFSHGRGISMYDLKRDLKLDIEDIDGNKAVRESLENYYELLANFLGTIGATGALHTSDMLVPIQ